MIYIHFSRISTANQEIEPAISIEENTNFKARPNSTKIWRKEICCEIWTHDLHFSRISTANQRNRTGDINWRKYQLQRQAISIEENTNFNVRLNSTKIWSAGNMLWNMHAWFTYHFSRISTANQKIEPAISIEENTNFNVRLNSTKIWSKWNMLWNIHAWFTLLQD